MVLDSVKDKITKEYLRQSQIKNKIQTKANAHTGTPTICPVGLDTDKSNAYYLPRWIGYTPKQTLTLERLPFAPAELDTHQSKRSHWNAYHLPRWIGYRQKQRPHWNAYYLHLLNWIQTKATPTLEHLPFALLDWIQTKANARTGTLTICPAGLDTHQNKRPEPQPLERLPFARQ